MMTHRLIIFFAVCLLSGNMSVASLASDTIAPHLQKQAIAEGIYLELVQAFGDGRTPPVLRLIPYADIKDSLIAAYLPGDVPKIVVEELAYDVCMSFEEDAMHALAALIGHELSHYFLRHDWANHYSRRLAHLSIAKPLQELDKKDRLRKEAEADFQGFFYGSVAGYETFRVAPDLLRRLYDAYRLPETMEGYPSLEQRIEAAKQSRAMVLRRWPVFEAGIYLFQVGAYEAAYACFENLLQDFTSKEHYNNAALAVMNMVQQERSGPTPIGNLDFRSGTSPTRGAATTAEKALLLKARRHLEESLRKDPAYLKGSYNLALCHLMLGNLDMAIGVLKDMEERADSLSLRLLEHLVALDRNSLPDLQQFLSPEDNWSMKAQAASAAANDEAITCLRTAAEDLKTVTDGVLLGNGFSLTVLQGNDVFTKGLIVRQDESDMEWRFFPTRHRNFCALTRVNTKAFMIAVPFQSPSKLSHVYYCNVSEK